MKYFPRVFALICSLILTVFISACDTKQPQVTNDALESPSIDHAKFTENCEQCHEPDRQRIGPNVDVVTTEHGFGLGCINCHSFPIWKQFPDRIKFHNPYPNSCTGCHSTKIESAPHQPFGDCFNCHTWPAWANLKMGLKEESNTSTSTEDIKASPSDEGHQEAQ